METIVNKQTARNYRRADAAAYLREKYGCPCSTQHLAKLAVIGNGPAFFKFGRYPIYPEAGLDRWAMARMSPPLASTSAPVEDDLQK